MGLFMGAWFGSARAGNIDLLHSLRHSSTMESALKIKIQFPNRQVVSEVTLSRRPRRFQLLLLLQKTVSAPTTAPFSELLARISSLYCSQKPFLKNETRAKNGKGQAQVLDCWWGQWQ
jgi:hypothetical protein